MANIVIKQHFNHDIEIIILKHNRLDFWALLKSIIGKILSIIGHSLTLPSAGYTVQLK